MDLIGSLTASNNIRGITLNSQQIDLFNIIEQAQNRDEAVEKIKNYLSEILQASKISKEMSTERKIKRVVYECANTVPNKEEFLGFLSKYAMQIRANWDTRERLEQLFQGKDIDSTYIDEILNIKKYFAYQTHGILTFLVDKNGNTINPDDMTIDIDKEKTYQKVQALYDYVIGNLDNGNRRFNRLTLDGQGKFGTVAGVMTNESESTAQPKDYNLEPLRQGYEFAKRHGIDEVYINALVFHKDFPDKRLTGENDKKYEVALVNYGKAIASIAREYEEQGIHTVIDMFNEFVDYNAPFSIRTNNWMSRLSIEELCRIASVIKEEMPNVDFGYNDWNFENPEKRKTIFEVIRKIQEYEKANGCKILDHIGTQCHTSINDLEGLRQSIEELQQFGLPIDITELDISKGLDGVDYQIATPDELAAIRKYEQKLQNEIMKTISKYVKEGKIRCVTSWSITDELCCDFCDGKEASVTGMSFDSEKGFTFIGKDMDRVIEMTEQEIQLIQSHKARVRENSKNERNQNPTQDFCLHTHTQRCGHGAENTGDEEWVQNAIKGGMKKLAFTDHIPLPEGYNKIPKSRMDKAEVDTYLASIRYLQEKYKGQIEIASGFEFEYSDRDLVHLQKLKADTDLMILGQHFVIDDNGKEYPIKRGKDGSQISDDVLKMYAKATIAAMEKGLPDIIAHPDRFMACRDSFGRDEEMVARDICSTASKKGIPLEINLGNIASSVERGLSIDEIKKKINYPSPEFWKVVAEETRIAQEKGQDLIVVFGKDAHFPEQLSIEKDYEIAKAIIGEDVLQQLHLVTKYKDLVVRRQTKSTQELGEETINEQKDTTYINEVEHELHSHQIEYSEEQKQ